VLLGRRIGGLEARHTTREVVKIMAATGVAVVAMLAAVWCVNQVTTDGDVRAVLQLAAGGAAGGLAFLAAAKAVEVEDLSLLTHLIPRRSRGAKLESTG
jgi:putative peptidoglycan lipid II flippase